MTDAESDARARTDELVARVRQLECLYRASDLLHGEGSDLGATLAQIPDLLVSGLRDPERARALLQVEGRRYTSSGGAPRSAGTHEPIVVGGHDVGSLHVAYDDGAPLTPDERDTVRALAIRIARLLDRRRTASGRVSLDEQLRHSQKMDAVGRLAGGIAHDFNNLLTSIKGLSALALKELEPGHPTRPDIEEIERAAQRAAALTRQLLAFSRKQMLRLTPLDLNAVVAGLADTLRRVVAERIELRTRYDASLPLAIADASQLEQVLMNLVVNARDATRGAGVITIATERAIIGEESATVPPGEYALLRVSDTGVGIPEHDLDKVFEPFFTTKSAGEGTGLGLATVFGIVKQGGGHVDVDSRPGEGATFKVYLPLATADAVPGETAGEYAGDAAHGTETILLAEDDPSVRGLVNRILEKAGYRVLKAEDGARALELAEAAGGRIELLLTDVEMPRGGGEELYERVHQRWPGVRVLYMSGYTDNPVIRREAEEAGGAYLAKPFSPEALLAAVRRVLDQESQTLADR